MNDIYLRGIIRDIQKSHTANNIEYDRATLIAKNSNGKESAIELSFKHFQNNYQNGDDISLLGNIRTLSRRGNKEHQSTLVYVFTYLDKLDEEFLEEDEIRNTCNRFQMDGVICKINEIHTVRDGKCNIQFTLHNTIEKNGITIDNYIPCIAWGKLAKKLSKCQIDDYLVLTGELRSRDFVKTLSNGDQEIRVTHEALISAAATKEELDSVETIEVETAESEVHKD